MRTQLKRDENVVLVIRPHWFILVWPTALTLVGIIIGILIGSYGFLIPFVLLCYLGFKVVQRKYNLWAVTNLRVIDEFGVFSHNSKESPLDKINNVTYNQSIWGRLFGYGNVQIQTAAEIGSTTYHLVERPQVLKDTITQMQEEYKRAQILSQAQELAKVFSNNNQKSNTIDVGSQLEKLFELKQKGILTEDEYNARKKKILEA